MELLNNFLFSVKNNRFYSKSDVQPYSDWIENTDYTGISLHPDGFYIFITHDQAISLDEYQEGTSDPYWEKTNPGYKDAEACMNECTLELIDIAGLKSDPSTCILDVACGKGSITANIKKKYPSTTIIGLDLSLTAIQEAVKEYNDIQFIVADSFTMPFAPKSFDLVVCNNFWEHIYNPYQLGNNFNNILKPNGSLIISTPSRYNFNNLWSVIAGRKVDFQNPTFHITEYSIGQIKEQLNRCGFTVEKIISKPVPLYGGSWKTKLKYKFVKPALQKLINLTHSHHILETSAFILAKKNK